MGRVRNLKRASTEKPTLSPSVQRAVNPVLDIPLPGPDLCVNREGAEQVPASPCPSEFSGKQPFEVFTPLNLWSHRGHNAHGETEEAGGAGTPRWPRSAPAHPESPVSSCLQKPHAHNRDGEIKLAARHR